MVHQEPPTSITVLPARSSMPLTFGRPFSSSVMRPAPLSGQCIMVPTSELRQRLYNPNSNYRIELRVAAFELPLICPALLSSRMAMEKSALSSRAPRPWLYVMQASKVPSASLDPSLPSSQKIISGSWPELPFPITMEKLTSIIVCTIVQGPVVKLFKDIPTCCNSIQTLFDTDSDRQWTLQRSIEHKQVSAVSHCCLQHSPVNSLQGSSAQTLESARQCTSMKGLLVSARWHEGVS